MHETWTLQIEKMCEPPTSRWQLYAMEPPSIHSLQPLSLEKVAMSFHDTIFLFVIMHLSFNCFLMDIIYDTLPDAAYQLIRYPDDSRRLSSSSAPSCWQSETRWASQWRSRWRQGSRAPPRWMASISESSLPTFTYQGLHTLLVCVLEYMNSVKRQSIDYSTDFKDFWIFFHSRPTRLYLTPFGR